MTPQDIREKVLDKTAIGGYNIAAVDQFREEAAIALAEGQKRGLDVFFGLEENHKGDEYLIYGLTKEYMKAHPEMEHWTRRQQLEEVHK